MSSLKHQASGQPPDGAQKKRRKGATRLSCAECRRLKLRCDRAIPCSSCVKRGCGAICPDGSLTTGQGNRFVLASTQELHEKISELANRVRELEDALRSAHSQLSNDQHPLLTEELLRVKAPLQREASTSRTNLSTSLKDEEQNPDVVDAFGSLSLSVSGRAKYYGQIANSWYFLENEAGEDEQNQIDDRIINVHTLLPHKILAKAAAFPISPVFHTAPDAVTLNSLYWYLPSPEKALELRSIYYRHAAWMYNPISQESFDHEIFNTFYYSTGPLADDDPLLSHKLSVLFMVLAFGTLMDTTQPAYNIESEKYNQLSRAALFQSAFFECPTMTAVQALVLMTFYLFFSDRHGSGSGARWALMGIAVKVAQSIGLHRDSGRWKGIDPAETQRRRELFWELFVYDSWQCLTFGRPPSFALPHLDCKLPYATDPTDEQSFHAWKHRFASECMNLLHDQAFGAKTPTYATILQLDRKLRAFPVPPILQVAGFGNSDPRSGGFPETIALTLQRHIVLAIRESNLLYLHRSFFARAISDHPKDPLGSPYGTSVIAAYRSAGSLIALMRNLHSQLKEPSERIWFLWTHMFSCAIILGSIVTRCPSMSLAPSALVQLDSACELFSKAASGFRADKVLTIMLSLQQRAHHCLEEFRKGRSPPLSRTTLEPSTPDDNDELAMLGGKTRLVKKEPTSPQLLERSPNSNHPVVPFPLPVSPSADVDPNVLEYLSSFQNHPSQLSASTSSYSDEMSPVSMFGMAPFQNEPSSYTSHSPQSISPSSHRQMSNGSSSFPQYFPVYDYGFSMQNGYMPPMLDVHPVPGGGQRRSSSGSPEANMLHTTWQDFVAGAVVN